MGRRLTALPAPLKSGWREHARQCAEERRPIRPAMAGIRRPLRMRHHSKNAAVFAENTRDVGFRPVGVVFIGKRNPVLALQTGNGVINLPKLKPGVYLVVVA